MSAELKPCQWRLADDGEPCEPPRCSDCKYCWPHEELIDDDYYWRYHCNLTEPDGKTIDRDEGEDHPAWCPLLTHNAPGERETPND